MQRAPLTRGFRPAAYIIFAAAFLFLLYVDRHQWFFYDEWEFLATRGLGGQSLRLFTPHNEHWVTVPILLFRGLYSVVGLHSYIPFLIVLLGLHVAAGFLVWRIMLRVGADGWVATALTAVFLLLGSAYENIIWAFQVGFIASVVCGLGATLLADHEGTRFGRRDLLVWLVCIVGLMSSGIGVTMVALVSVVALLKRGWRAGLITVSVPAGVYLVWLIVVGHQGFVGTQVSKTSLLLIPDYVWTGLSGSVDGATGLVGFGAVAVIGMFVWALLNRAGGNALAPAFAGAITSAIFFLLAGAGRTSFGVSEAASPRYVYVATALLLPIASVILSSLARRALVAQLAVIGVAIFSLGHNVNILALQAHFFAGVKEQSRQQILAGARLITSGQQLIGTRPDPLFAPDLTTSDLATMLHEGALPPLSDLSSAAMADAELALQVELSPSPLVGINNPVAVTVGHAGSLTALANGCIRADSNGTGYVLTLEFGGASSVRLESTAEATIKATLAVPSSNTVSDVRSLAIPAATPEYLSSDLPAAGISLTVPASSLTLCGNVSPGAAP